MYRVTLETTDYTYEYEIDAVNEQKAVTDAFKQLEIELRRKPNLINVDVIDLELN